tara:strand:+ start:421 stop:615 length:195 start_codon:yes stop_codon:yes gene_type:complete
MPKYNVCVVRIGYAVSEFEVEADNPEDAERKAMDEAYNYGGFSEHSSDYSVDEPPLEVAETAED